MTPGQDGAFEVGRHTGSADRWITPPDRRSLRSRDQARCGRLPDRETPGRALFAWPLTCERQAHGAALAVAVDSMTRVGVQHRVVGGLAATSSSR